jgi:predicted flap endonuclease-1-like 5' DNA nuclease
MTPSSEAHDVTGIESRDRELGEPSLETRREPSHRAGDGTTIEPTRGAIVFLDADGHVIERAPVSSDLDHSSEAGDPDSSSAPSKADTHLEQSSEAEIDTADAPPSPVPADGRASGDDLELIRGIGPVYADALITLGYTTFDSIAALDDEDIERIELLVGPIRRRMEHHRWKEHARSLQRETLGAAGAVEATDRLQHDSTDPQSSQPEPADHPQGRP